MITFQIMDAAFQLPTCLHGGPVPLSACRAPATLPAYVETVSDIPTGAVARMLQSIGARYDSCGVMAVRDGLVVGKIRAYPQTIVDRVPFPCVQGEKTVIPLLRLETEELPTREQYPVLHVYCIQVAAEYCGRGIAGDMLDALIAASRADGWRELRARAVGHIPPLLTWCGQLSRAALERRGFRVADSALSPELLEGVVSQRGGFHGDAVREQWKDFDHVSDEDAALVFNMTLDLRQPEDAILEA